MVAELLGICGVFAWLFYKSVWALLAVVPLFPFYYRFRGKMEEKNQKSRLQYEFKEMITATAAALDTGYSMENALREAQKSTASLLGEKAGIVHSLSVINRRIALHEPVEKVLMDFADASEIEDISNFASIFAYAKRSGGNYAAIMKNTASTIQDKIDVAREIETVLAEKKMEARIMDVVPLGMIFYLDMTSPDFLAALYGNVTGVAVMTVCLLVYLFGVFLGEKLLDIKV